MGFLIDYILPFIVLLGALIFFHELGHFTLAKLFGVGVERFNLGFGRRIFFRKWGETEYGLSLIPFGGYVKMIGEHPDEAPDLTDEQKSRSFMHKPPWQRALIVFCGPLANWLLAVLIIGGIYMVGYPKPAPVIGRVYIDSAAAQAQLLPGDEIVAIDGSSIGLWDDVVNAVQGSQGSELEFAIRRDGGELSLPVQPRLTEGLDRFANKTDIWSIGIDNFPLSSQVGLVGSETPAARAGFKTADTIRSVNSNDVRTWRQFQSALAAAGYGPIELAISRPSYTRGKGDELEVVWQELNLSVPAGGEAWSAQSLGVGQVGLFFYDVDPDKAAGQAGIEPGDQAVSIDGNPLSYSEQFIEYVQPRPDTPVVIGLIRDGVRLDLQVTARSEQNQDILGEISSIGRIGASFYGARALPELRIDRTHNPFKALYMATVDTGRLTAEMGRFLVALFSGQANVHGLGGPILIAKVAGDSAKQGPFTFLMMMAFISINLALVNLLPLPVLDGGMLVLIGLERVRGKPLPLRTLEWIGSIGFGMIILLMMLIIFLDVSRFSLPIKNFFIGLF
ncbi:MAG: RIP metalloprotease RseP [Candidatus Alcyoniella australis]|nr:RIP metalloprotease RseP [Candidatus Alcyoniella australis]